PSRAARRRWSPSRPRPRRTPRSTCPPVDGEDDPAVDAQVRRHHVETLRPHTALEDRLHERRAPGVRLMSTFFTGSPSSPSAPSTGFVERLAAQRLAQPAHLAASGAWWCPTARPLE